MLVLPFKCALMRFIHPSKVTDNIDQNQWWFNNGPQTVCFSCTLVFINQGQRCPLYTDEKMTHRLGKSEMP